MNMIILLLLCLVASITTTTPPFCYLEEGCANVNTCQCIWFMTYCNVDTNPAGTCTLTPAGIIIIFSLVLFLLITLIVFICCCCCCCGRPSCCKPKKDNYTNIHYHHPQPNSYPSHSKL